MNFILSDINNEELLFIEPKICTELSDKLSSTKDLIDNYTKQWIIAKKNIHKYEYIFTSSYKPKNISDIKPISRSYFKFRELNIKYNLFNPTKKNTFLCLAEAPGGFIESILHSLSNYNINVIHAITLLSEDKSIPRWNRLLLKNKIIKFHKGIKGDGNLIDLPNILSFIKIIGKQTVDLITGDGGFDYSSNYSKQEEDSLRLIYSEVFLALNLQKDGGTFICKLFDIFLRGTINLIYILRRCYREVFIHKPCVSRISNSEKYIICIGYKGYNKEIINNLCHNFSDMNINYPIGRSFINDIISLNTIYCNEQIDSINKGIELIRYNSFNKKPTLEQINIAIQWCKEYNIPLNKNCFYLS